MLVTLLNNLKKYSTGVKLAGLSILLLIAYTWAQPYQEIYGLYARNALMARGMLENGMSLIPKVLGHPYPDYPPLYFWLETIFSLPLGKVTPLSAALPSTLSAVGLVVMTFLGGRRISEDTGWFAAFILATMPPFWLEAGSATIDMLLAFNVAAAIFSLSARAQKEGSSQKLIYTSLAIIFMVLAFLSKGPIGVVLPGVVWGGYLLWQKRWRELCSFSLLIIVIGVICAGLELAIVYHAGGKQLVNEVIKMQVAGRLGAKSNQPFYYYLGCLQDIGNLWWIVIICGSFCRLKSRTEKISIGSLQHWLKNCPEISLMITWTLGILTIFTIASTKKVRYLLPLYPAVAIIIAYWINQLQKDGCLNTPPVLLKVIKGLAIFALLAGSVFYLLYSRLIFIPLVYLLIWLGVGITGFLYTTKYVDKKYYLRNSILHLLFVLLIGTNLLVTPASSRRASGKEFINTIESQVDSDIPLLIYKINPDGNGIRFAYNSRRGADKIYFVNDIDKLKSFSPPYLIITEFQSEAESQKLGSEKKSRLITHGHIRSHKFSAFMISLKN